MQGAGEGMGSRKVLRCTFNFTLHSYELIAFARDAEVGANGGLPSGWVLALLSSDQELF